MAMLSECDRLRFRVLAHEAHVLLLTKGRQQVRVILLVRTDLIEQVAEECVGLDAG